MTATIMALPMTLSSAEAGSGPGGGFAPHEQVPAANPNLPATTNVGAVRGQTGGIQTPQFVMGTSGCYGQTDQPHPSSHVNGTVNVVSRTVCPTTDYVSVAQYRSRWYGWQSWGSGSQTRYGTATANAAGACASGDTYTYLANGYHEGQGAGYAYTSNSRRFTCP